MRKSAPALLLLFAPQAASALVIEQVAGTFNILVGLMLVASLLTFGGGFMMYIARLGTEHRVDGIRYMEWGVNILFVLIVLLAIVKFIQGNAGLASFLVGIAIVGGFAWLVASTVQQGGEEHEEH